MSSKDAGQQIPPQLETVGPTPAQPPASPNDLILQRRGVSLPQGSSDQGLLAQLSTNPFFTAVSLLKKLSMWF